MHSTRLSERHLFPLRWPPKEHIVDRTADKPGLAVEMTLRGRDDGALCHNGSARPRSLETRKGRGFPHSHSDGGCAYQNWGKVPNPRPTDISTDSRAEPFFHLLLAILKTLSVTRCSCSGLGRLSDCKTEGECPDNHVGILDQQLCDNGRMALRVHGKDKGDDW